MFYDLLTIGSPEHYRADFYGQYKTFQHMFGKGFLVSDLRAEHISAWSLALSLSLSLSSGFQHVILYVFFLLNCWLDLNELGAH